MIEYSGKNAWWLILIVVIYNLLPPVLIYLNPNEDFFAGYLLFVWILYYSIDFVWLPVMIRNRVELYDDYFIFYYGFTKEKIYLAKLKKIEKSNNLIASSANALDRLHLIMDDKDFYLALKDNDAFIKEISKRSNKNGN